MAHRGSPEARHGRQKHTELLRNVHRGCRRRDSHARNRFSVFAQADETHEFVEAVCGGYVGARSPELNGQDVAGRQRLFVGMDACVDQAIFGPSPHGSEQGPVFLPDEHVHALRIEQPPQKPGEQERAYLLSTLVT